MNGEERRKQIYRILQDSDKPVSGSRLAKMVNVSRQAVVQDIALMRANGALIFSTNRGYFVQKASATSRVFKTIHTDEETREELCTIVDAGGKVDDVFVFHRLYGILRADLNLKSRRDIDLYISGISKGHSSLLKNITSGYHYHTVTADSPEILDIIQDRLQKRGFLAPLQDYEPVDFWKEKDSSDSSG